MGEQRGQAALADRAGADRAELQARERELKRLTRRIDGALRRRYVTRRLRRMLRPPAGPAEQGRRVRLWGASGGTVFLSLIVWGGLSYRLLRGTAALRWLSFFLGDGNVGLAYPRLRYAFGRIPGPPAQEWVPAVALALAGAVLVGAGYELWLQPRLALLRHRFRLMRYEGGSGDARFPCLFTVARATTGTTGFETQTWKAVPGLQPGDIVIGVANGKNEGVATIPLRTDGRLPIMAWHRGVYQEDVLPPLTPALQALAHAFGEGCDVHHAIVGRLARSRAVQPRALAGTGVPPPIPPIPGATPPAASFTPTSAWQGLALSDALRHELQTLGLEFVSGSPAASRGLLLFGPPGTGKTLIARALAESLGCAFFPLTVPDLKAMHIGESGQRVQEIWRKARAQPRAVLFVDECETVFGRRGGAESDSFVSEIVTAFLPEWDGVSRQSNVWVIGATNRVDLLDPAVLSRFDEQHEVGLPDDAQRLAILAAELARLGRHGPLPEGTVEITTGLSGRDLATLAKRLVRDRELGPSGPVTAEALQRLAQAFRKQGATATDEAARWETLVLPERTLRLLKTTAGMLKDAAVYQRRGIDVPRGILLHGPPGTGKTQIARTLANETGLHFIGLSTSDLKQKWVGHSGQKVREIFERAREVAPSLLFIDEIDLVASGRGGEADGFQQEILGQLLQELDGVKATPEPVFVLAATNRLDDIDAALRSRFPKHLEISLPDREGLERILAVLLAGKPLGFDAAAGAAQLAARAQGRSGRDLRNWVMLAEQNAVARAHEAGTPEDVQLRLEDFEPLDPA